jgi:serine/threonine protein kinase
MGEVYRARDTRLDRSVAIKILPTHLSSNHEAKQRFFAPWGPVYCVGDLRPETSG